MPPCPACQHPATKRSGRDRRGRQQCACSSCRRTFTENTASAFSGYRWPLDVILKQDVIQANRALLDGLSVGKGCIRYTKPERVKFEVVKKLLEGTRESKLDPCAPIAPAVTQQFFQATGWMAEANRQNPAAGAAVELTGRHVGALPRAEWAMTRTHSYDRPAIDCDEAKIRRSAGPPTLLSS